MPQHEPKICTRCSKDFVCRVGDVPNCHCSSITLTIEERAFIEDRYHDCLCIDCLKDLKNKYVLFKEKYFPGE